MRDLFKNACKELELNITEKQIEEFFIYKNLLLKWNEKINLKEMQSDPPVSQTHS